MAAQFDRTVEDVGNIVHLEHVNVQIPDQDPATQFYVVGLGLTRDPYLMVGLDNMWVNVGRSQFHMPTREPAPQRVRGTVGLVVADLDHTERSLEKAAPRLDGSCFGYRRTNEAIEATCPWGNRIRVHPPSEAFGPIDLGMPYVEFDVPPGTAPGIARFYREMLEAPAEVTERAGAPAASVTVGAFQRLHFRETDGALPDYDGHHVAIYIADFSGPYRRLMDRGLISRETNQHEWRFTDIVDLDSGEVLFVVEHETRSLKHPMYARPLVNRNPVQTQPAYVRGQDAFAGRA